ncbi:MAG: hypothetical protein ACOH1V_03835 [Stenotrophomonas sp.]
MAYRYWITAVLLGSLVGCPAVRPSRPAADSAHACSDKLPDKGITRVYVDIDLSAGKPSATPPLCVVRGGTEVVWRTRSNEPFVFELVFVDSPGRAVTPPRQMRVMAETRFPSARSGERQQVAITTRQVMQETLISYDIITGQGSIDPGIKIVPQ